ncbi:MAG: hypothetical protein JXC85_01820 [Candidatus Aenigmarchaeota archaeon]|nr:hypothetical protein [Candidatus Aenigmarchaeota archaeon]
MHDIAIVSSYPSTNPECGIGIYTKNLWRELKRFPMVDDLYICSYGNHRPKGLRERVLKNPDDPVQLWFNQDSTNDVQRVTRQIYKRAKASGNPTMVILMLEYGLTENAGDGSDNAVHMAKNLKGKDIVTIGIAHTIRRNPSKDQRDILVETARECDGTVVHTHSSIDVLRSPVYGLKRDECNLYQVHHGTRYIEKSDRDRRKLKRKLGAEDKTLISSVGLRGPGKGTDLFIRAVDLFFESLPRSQRKRIKAIRAGGYHPKFVEAEGGKYMNQHIELIDETLSGTKLQVYRPPNDDIYHIDWDAGDYISIETPLDTVKYMTTIGASKICAFTYPDPEQDTSGTLADAMGWGRAIVSTDFAFAKEMIGCRHPKKKGVMNIGDPDARGLLTHCGEPSVEETAQALDYLLISREGQRLRSQYEHNAHVLGHETAWPNSAWKICQYGDFLHTEKNMVRGRMKAFRRSKPKPHFASSNPN